MGSNDADVFRVVLTPTNDTKILPNGQPLPSGYRETGKSGSMAECLEFMDEGVARPPARRRRFGSILPVRRQRIGYDLAGNDLRDPDEPRP